MLERKRIKVKAIQQNIEKRAVGTATIQKHHIDVPILISILSFIIAMLSFLFATYPQLNPFNSNVIEKANAGDTKSQLILAEHYYEIADIADSIYWYKIASTQKSIYQAAALNNIAYIYVNSDSITKWDEFSLIKAYKIFLKAGDLGEVSALRNAYILLHEIPKDILQKNGYSFLDEKRTLMETLQSLGIFSKELKEISFHLEYVGHAADLADCDTSEYVQIATRSELRSVLNDEGMTYPVWYTEYDMYRVVNADGLPEYVYIHIDNLF